mmetsp:Transcript_22083/g.48230  ORF Transcript_22083/g.48230 Transcript_22083/m.48230 type:complete len:119 (+) Transcript_22083:525-881(+)
MSSNIYEALKAHNSLITSSIQAEAQGGQGLPKPCNEQVQLITMLLFTQTGTHTHTHTHTHRDTHTHPSNITLHMSLTQSRESHSSILMSVSLLHRAALLAMLMISSAGSWTREGPAAQ